MKFRTLIQTSISLGLGSATGAVVSFFAVAQGDLKKVDWHQLGITALVTGTLAVLTHWFPPPNAAPK